MSESRLMPLGVHDLQLFDLRVLTATTAIWTVA